MRDRESYRAVLEALDRILNRGGEPDEVLQKVVAVLHRRAGFDRAAIAVVGGGEHEAGSRGAGEAVVPVVFRSRRVAELRVEPPLGEDDEARAFLERVALLVSAHCASQLPRSGDDAPVAMRPGGDAPSNG
jgi:hypothetical protein